MFNSVCVRIYRTIMSAQMIIRGSFYSMHARLLIFPSVSLLTFTLSQSSTKKNEAKRKKKEYNNKRHSHLYVTRNDQKKIIIPQSISSKY